jgi:hypothetical protein
MPRYTKAELAKTEFQQEQEARQERNERFTEWKMANPGKEPVNFCATCNLIMYIPMTPKEHYEKYGHMPTGI